jgi:hypothetical protein
MKWTISHKQDLLNSFLAEQFRVDKSFCIVIEFSNFKEFFCITKLKKFTLEHPNLKDLTEAKKNILNSSSNN